MRGFINTSNYRFISALVFLCFLFCSCDFSTSYNLESKLTMVCKDRERDVSFLDQGIQHGEYTLYESDILIPEEEENLAKNDVAAFHLKETVLWPDGIVTYCWNGNFPDSLKTTVQHAFDMWQNYGDIEFVEGQCGGYVYEIKLDEEVSAAASTVGYQKKSVLKINPGIRSSFYGILLHEVGHCLGLLHEHQHPERDQYISLVNEHFQTEILNSDRFRENFDKVNDIEAITFLPYDYESIMHYAKSVWGEKDEDGNVLNTIEVLDSNFIHIVGQRSSLSQGDIWWLRINYGSDHHKLYFSMQDQKSGDYLGAADGLHKKSAPEEVQNIPGLHWEFIYMSQGYMLKNRKSNHCLAAVALGEEVEERDCNPSDSKMLFIFEFNNDETSSSFQIRRKNSCQYLENYDGKIITSNYQTTWKYDLYEEVL